MEGVPRKLTPRHPGRAPFPAGAHPASHRRRRSSTPTPCRVRRSRSGSRSGQHRPLVAGPARTRHQPAMTSPRAAPAAGFEGCLLGGIGLVPAANTWNAHLVATRAPPGRPRPNGQTSDSKRRWAAAARVTRDRRPLTPWTRPITHIPVLPARTLPGPPASRRCGVRTSGGPGDPTPARVSGAGLAGLGRGPCRQWAAAGAKGPSKAAHCRSRMVLPSVIRPSRVMARASAKGSSRTSMSSPSSSSPPPAPVRSAGV